MNGDDLREALRAPAGIDPLDPAKLIAGAHRRRRRGIATVGASAGAVLAVVAVSVIVGIRPSDSPVIEQPVVPSISTPTPTPTPAPVPTPPPTATPTPTTPSTPVPPTVPLNMGASSTPSSQLSSPAPPSTPRGAPGTPTAPPTDTPGTPMLR